MTGTQSIFITVFLIIGVVGILAGILVLRSQDTSTEGFEHVTATLCGTRMTDSFDQVKPVVEFELDGEPMRFYCQPVSEKKITARTGDTVQVYVRRDTSMGLPKWTVLLDVGEDTVRNQIRLRTMAGGIILGVGILMLAAGAIVFFATRRG